mmetsp:Transcript_6168/g.15824  ORF Transcript_6168/g.15824 Transcript_6168/m.15824 type:complete len:287 (+) Transcript_6168:217-1077(+)
MQLLRSPARRLASVVAIPAGPAPLPAVASAGAGAAVPPCASRFNTVVQAQTHAIAGGRWRTAPVPRAGRGGNGLGAASWENPGRRRTTTPGPTLPRGEIQLIVGPMFAGKSTEMVRRLKRYRHADLRCAVLKHNADVRYTERSAVADFISTHDTVNVMEAIQCGRLEDAWSALEHIDVVGIDEGQFFEDLVSFCEKAAGNGKVVVVSALDGTFLREPFGEVCQLVPRCESVVKLTAVCAECGDAAPFSRRLVSSTETTLIGGRDEYAPVCRRHWRAPAIDSDHHKE